MGYVERNLAPGENLTCRTGCPWIVMFWPVVGGGVLGYVGFVLLTGGLRATRNGGRYEGAMVWGSLDLLGAGPMIGGGVIRWLGTEVGVSNRRVLIKTGLFSRRSIEVLPPKVESVGVDESLPGRILGYGTLIVLGTGGTFETFDKIAHPSELRRQVQERLSSATMPTPN